MKGTLVFLTSLLWTLLLFQNSSFVFAVEEEDVKWSITITESRILDCYEAVAEADEAGANITSLLAVLEEGGWSLSKAKLAYRYGDFDSALNHSDESRGKLEGLMDEAWTLKEEALEKEHLDFMVFFVGSLVGSGMVAITGCLVWIWLKRRFGLERVAEYGLLFVIVVGFAALVVASPGLSRVLVYPRSEFFTEFWVLDAEGKAENYPFNISSAEEYQVILGIGDQLGYCGYYLVQTKFRNESMPAPDTLNQTPSSLQPRLNVSAFVEDEGVWHWPLTFSIEYKYNESASRVEVDSLILNDLNSDVNDCTLQWDEERQGFLGDLFFELWIFNGTTGTFEYHERFLTLKLNLTIPPQ